MKHARSDYDRIQDPAGLIPDDEPVFLLRAQDPAAADTVRFWAFYQQRLGAHERITDKAWEWAEQMDRWPVKKRVADLSDGV